MVRAVVVVVVELDFDVCARVCVCTESCECGGLNATD